VKYEILEGNIINPPKSDTISFRVENGEQIDLLGQGIFQAFQTRGSLRKVYRRGEI
jgi:hypothetical protein